MRVTAKIVVYIRLVHINRIFRALIHFHCGTHLPLFPFLLAFPVLLDHHWHPKEKRISKLSTEEGPGLKRLLIVLFYGAMQPANPLSEQRYVNYILCSLSPSLFQMFKSCSALASRSSGSGFEPWPRKLC